MRALLMLFECSVACSRIMLLCLQIATCDSYYNHYDERVKNPLHTSEVL